jgi:hypothetical protein
MCPFCLSAIAWLALGGGSAATAGAMLVGWRWKGKDDDDDDGNHAPDREP